MEHTMRLNPVPFAMIKSGQKTIELRLYDEKRQKIAPRDTIHFHNTADPDQTILATVQELYVFSDFAELYNKLPLLECGYTKENVAEATPKDMEQYYPLEKQSQFGVVGIRVAVMGV